MNAALNISLATLWVHEIKHSSCKAFIRPRRICNEHVGEISPIKSQTICVSYFNSLQTVNSCLQTVNSSLMYPQYNACHKLAFSASKWLDMQAEWPSGQIQCEWHCVNTGHPLVPFLPGLVCFCRLHVLVTLISVKLCCYIVVNS